MKTTNEPRSWCSRYDSLAGKGLPASSPLHLGVPVQFSSGNTSSNLSRNAYECYFDLLLPEGKCIGLRSTKLSPGHRDELSRFNILKYRKEFVTNSENLQSTTLSPHHWIYDCLHPGEVEYGLAKLKGNIKNAQCFLLGRLALRKGLNQFLDNNNLAELEKMKDHCILKDSYGRPQLLNGYLGSISHKENLGVALVTKLQKGVDATRMGIGIDIEKRFPSRMNIARKILSPNEIDDLGKLDVSSVALFDSRFTYNALPVLMFQNIFG